MKPGSVRGRPRGAGDPSTPPPAGVRPLVIAVLFAVAVGVIVAVTTLLRFDDLVAATHAADPTQSSATVSSTLWSRIGVAGGVALVWPLLLRRLIRGNTRIYARIQRVSIIAAAALLVVLFLGTAPVWLHVLQGVQAAAQLGVFAMTFRPSLRDWYAAHRQPPVCPGAWRPILLLVVLAPLTAEVSIGDLPFNATGAAAALFTLPVYGPGALLVRELTRRTGRGWPTILLLGASYCLVEEGLGLQSLFSPTMYHGLGPELGARVAGVNGVYLLLQLVNHAVWSIAVPIALTELTFRDTRAVSWVGSPGLIVTSVVYLIGAVLMLLIHLQNDPNFFAPGFVLLGTAVLAVVIAVIALTALPRVTDRVRTPATTAAPSPLVVGAVGLVAAFGFLAILNLPGRAHLGLIHGPGVIVPIVLAIAVVAIVGRLAARWTRSPTWTDQHCLALAGGSVLGHTIAWAPILATSDATRIGVIVLLLASIALLLMLNRRLGHPTPRPVGALQSH